MPNLHQATALDLVSAALDPAGFICIVGIEQDKTVRQSFFQPGDYQAAVDGAMQLSHAGSNAYFSTSTMLSSSSRKNDNVHAIKVLKLDLDVELDNVAKYPSQRAAVEALEEFTHQTGLPVPTLVDSGYGVHVYWCLTEALNAADGKKYCEKLKAVCAAYGLKQDVTVTGDIARILRVPGTLNYKIPSNPKAVKLKNAVILHDTDSVLDKLDALYVSATRHRSIAVTAPPQELTLGPVPAHLKGYQVTDKTHSLIQDGPKLFSLLLERSLAGTGCNHIRFLYENQQQAHYDYWRSGLSIATFCTDRETAIHEISRHHDMYTPEETIRKAADIGGPHFCTTFAQLRPGLCDDCRHFGHIATPIQLAAVEDRAATTCVDVTSMSTDQALAAVQGAIERAKDGDCGAPFEPKAISALQTFKKNDPAEFQRLRAALKKSNRDISISSLDALVMGETESKDRNASDALVSLAREQCSFFHDPDGEAHATFQREGHRECWHLHSRGFTEWLSYQFYQLCGSAPAEPSMMTAISTLAGQAKFEGEERPVAVRVAKHGADYYIDLCNETWQAVRVTSEGWQIIDAPPVMFVRSGAMRSLPTPVAGCRIEGLWQFANIATEDRELVLTWIIEAYRPDTPFPCLELFAEQGAAKSSTQSFLRDLIDPNRANLRARPKTIDDLFISAKASHVTSLENLSFLSPDFQDALCSLATGAGYGGRTLYTNSDETVFDLKRPAVFNGISVVATRQDLMDRTLLVELPPIAYRRSESEMHDGFEQAKPGIFGALLTLFSQALAILPSVQIVSSDLPRMADFAFLGEAVFRALGRQDGEFLTKYHEKRRHGITQTIESSPVAAALIAWLDKNPVGFSGPLKQLHMSLAPFRPDGDQWPRSLHSFGDSLRRIKPALHGIGIDVSCLGRKRDGYHWQVQSDVSPPA